MFFTIKKRRGNPYKCYVCGNTLFLIKKIFLGRNSRHIKCKCSVCESINIIPTCYVDINTLKVTSK